MSEPERATFTPWFWSGRAPAIVEAVVVACVFAGVIAVAIYLVQMPGPLVVHLQDDARQAVKGARVRCVSPDGQTAFAGETDVFGEAKWPGLAKGPWTCTVTPPPRYHAEPQIGVASVVARRPALWTTSVERPARLTVSVVRPEGGARAEVAVRAVCEGGASWEARAGLLDGRAELWIPAGRACRVGLVRPELPSPGPVPAPALACDRAPCAGPLSAGVGEQRSAQLRPTAAQWAAARPPPEPEEPAGAK